jgi:uncharacterized integral membrane protein (TIGR00698 family)
MRADRRRRVPAWSIALDLGSLGHLLPGLAAVAAVAVLARMATTATGAPAVMLALAGGLLLSPLTSGPGLRAGLNFGARHVLRAGVVLLGAQITLQQVLGLGLLPFLVTLLTLALSLGLGLVIARRLGVSAELAWLSAAAVSICGASAALAVAAILPRTAKLEESAAATVGGITIVGTLAMLLYPQLAAWLYLSNHEAGLFLGASLHEVAQAIGAGFAFSDEAGQVATTIKLVRVACLGPVVLLLAWVLRRQDCEAAAAAPLVPGFVLGFLLMVALSSVGLLPAALIPLLVEISRFCLLVAIAALGMKVDPRKLAAFGAAPAAALLLQTVLIAALALTGTLLIRAAG